MSLLMFALFVSTLLALAAVVLGNDDRFFSA